MYNLPNDMFYIDIEILDVYTCCWGGSTLQFDQCPDSLPAIVCTLSD